MDFVAVFFGVYFAISVVLNNVAANNLQNVITGKSTAIKQDKQTRGPKDNFPTQFHSDTSSNILFSYFLFFRLNS